MAAAVAVSGAGAPQGANPNEQLLTDPNVIIRRYQGMQQECQGLAGKVGVGRPIDRSTNGLIH